MNLCWENVDVITGFLTVRESKHGRARRVPMNSTVRSVLFDLSARRLAPDDPTEFVFSPGPKQSDRFFPKALKRAQAALLAAGKDASRLDSYVWHANRHTFASRLAMAGVDLLAIKELGGWRTMVMVQRRGTHISPRRTSTLPSND